MDLLDHTYSLQTQLIRIDGVVPLHSLEQPVCHSHTNGLNTSRLNFFFLLSPSL